MLAIVRDATGRRPTESLVVVELRQRHLATVVDALVNPRTVVVLECSPCRVQIVPGSTRVRAISVIDYAVVAVLLFLVVVLVIARSIAWHGPIPF